MIFDTVLAQLAPYECLGCAAEGCLLCVACSAQISRVPARCYRCHRLVDDFKTCSTCRATSELYRVIPFALYDGLAKALVWQLKFNGAQAAADEMSEFMQTAFGNNADLLVPVPTATSRRRKRGYDQAVLLARALASRMGVPYLPCLRRLGQHEQVGASRQQRITQLRDAYRCVSSTEIRTKHIVLVDDVLTTGATLEAAAKILKAAGAKRVSAVVFAQA